MAILTDNFNFQPEELIRIDGVLYVVFYDTGEELGDFPILAEVDADTFLQEGALNNVTDLGSGDEALEAFTAKYGYVFRGHADFLVSDIEIEGEGQDYRGIMDLAEAKLNKDAKEAGMEWLLDVDVQVKFLSAVLTGKPVTQDDLADTQWYLNSTPAQRNFISEFYADPKGVQEKISQNLSDISQALWTADFKGDITGLAKELAFGITSGKYTDMAEVDMYISYLSDEWYLELVGGEQMLPEELRPFIGQFNNRNGYATVDSYITQLLGKGAIDGYKSTGQYNQFAGMVRNGQGDKVQEDLQKVHDTLYPAFAGSSFSVWNPYFSNRASRMLYGTTGSQVVALTTKDQEKINDLIVDAGGDYNKFDALVRKEFQDAPGISNSFLDDLTRAIPQSYSGVFGG
tara:strand:+ start:8005 stop:9207 length:1203 start_codon:yes stop_codon:yes gene_type:complete